MQKISINDLYEIDNALVHDGYSLVSHKKGLLKYQSKDSEMEIALKDYLNENPKVLKADYDNCILNCVASIKKYFGKHTNGIKTNPILDEILATKKYKHIAIMLLDGMGSYIIKENLPKEAILNKNKVTDISSVYPSTTACAIPALRSGKEPLETAWVGWQNYFKEFNRNIILFKNQDYYTGEYLDMKIEKDILPYKPFYQDLGIYNFELGPSFYENGCESFKELKERYLAEIKKHDESFAYLYWDNPDYIMHETGPYSKEAKEVLEDLNKEVEDLYDKMGDDTLIITTADHGHIAVNPIYFHNFHTLANKLQRLPGNEGRAAFFKVKLFQKLSFAKQFKRYFGSYYKLMTTKEFVKQGYLGKNFKKVNSRLNSFFGDYVAIATSNYYFNFNPKVSSTLEDELVFKSHHAGTTANEVLVPLIILHK